MTTVDGTLVESLHVEEARRVIAMAKAVAGVEASWGQQGAQWQ